MIQRELNLKDMENQNLWLLIKQKRRQKNREQKLLLPINQNILLLFFTYFRKTTFRVSQYQHVILSYALEYHH